MDVFHAILEKRQRQHGTQCIAGHPASPTASAQIRPDIQAHEVYGSRCRPSRPWHSKDWTDDLLGKQTLSHAPVHLGV